MITQKQFQILHKIIVAKIGDLLEENEKALLAAMGEAENEAEAQGKDPKFSIGFAAKVADDKAVVSMTYSVAHKVETPPIKIDAAQLDLLDGPAE